MSSHASILYKIAILFVCEITGAFNKLLQYFPLVCYFKIQFIASCLLDKLSNKSKKCPIQIIIQLWRPTLQRRKRRKSIATKALSLSTYQLGKCQQIYVLQTHREIISIRTTSQAGFVKVFWSEIIRIIRIIRNNLIFLGKTYGSKDVFNFVVEISNTGFDFGGNVAIKFCNYVFTYC